MPMFRAVDRVDFLRAGRAELEAWSLGKEAAYFREVLRRELLVEVA